MRRRLLTLVIPALLCIASGAWADKPPKFMGSTSSTVPGNVSLVGMNLLCQEEFGKKARMCTTRDLVDGTPVVPPSINGAWIHPIAVAFTGTELVDVSGRRAIPGEFSCEAWESAAAKGMLILDDLSLQFVDCDDPRSVACCRP